MNLRHDRNTPLEGRVALVAGATRATGRAIAVELGALGATVYATGRTTSARPSEMGRPETIGQTAAAVDAAGGTGIAVRVDHSVPDEVAALVRRIDAGHGRLDILVNDVWGGDMFTEWGRTLWEHSLDKGLRLLHQAVDTHLITSHHALPLLIRRPGGLVVEMTDGKAVDGDYRESVFYDLAKVSVIRLAQAQAFELRPHAAVAVAVTPGWIRSERMLEKFGVTEATWRDGTARDPHFCITESPFYVARGIAALATDPHAGRLTGQTLSSADLAAEYSGLTDVDGTRPDFPRYFAEVMTPERPAGDAGYR